MSFQAISDSTRDAIIAINALNALHEDDMRMLSEARGRAKSTLIKLFKYLESNPIIEIRRTADELRVTFNTVAKAMERLIDMVILALYKKTGRARTFAYQAYIYILKQNI